MALKTNIPVIEKKTGKQGIVLATHIYTDNPDAGQFASVRFPDASHWMHESELQPVGAEAVKQG
jgi:hypothetical protein